MGTIDTPMILYTRVSTGKQAESGLGLDAQLDLLRRHAQLSGWEHVVEISDAGESAKSMNRPGMKQARKMLAKGEAAGIAVAKLDRISRSVIDFANLVAQSKAEGWSLVLLDLCVDTNTATGSLVANVMSALAEWERAMASERTSAALRAAQRNGKHVGRPIKTDAKTRDLIRDRRAIGDTYKEIAEKLNNQGTKTSTGRTWTVSSVSSALRSIEHQADLAEHRDLTSA